MSVPSNNRKRSSSFGFVESENEEKPETKRKKTNEAKGSVHVQKERERPGPLCQKSAKVRALYARKEDASSMSAMDIEQLGEEGDPVQESASQNAPPHPPQDVLQNERENEDAPKAKRSRKIAEPTQRTLRPRAKK